MKVRFRILLSALCVVALASAAPSDTRNYGDLLGSATGDVDFLQVTESSSTDGLPLFGLPTRSGNSLMFFPMSFASEASEGTSDTTVGQLAMNVRADTGYYLTRVSVEEIGDYKIVLTGGASASADVAGTLTVEDVATQNQYVDTMDFTPVPVYDEDTGGQSEEFSGSVSIDLTGLNITEIEFTLLNELETDSEAGSSAFIEKKVLSQAPRVVVEVIPEPACMSLLALGGAGILFRRRRRSA